jgi:PPOX class probable F420-dependent enzyme
MATVPASHADLIEKNQILIMATNGPNGFPQVTAMWFLHQDGMLRVSLNDTRQKTRNLLNDQKVSLFFVDPENPYRTLEIRAIASVDPDPDYVFAAEIGAKYSANLREMDPPGELRVVVTFDPVKVNTFG